MIKLLLALIITTLGATGEVHKIGKTVGFAAKKSTGWDYDHKRTGDYAIQSNEISGPTKLVIRAVIPEGRSKGYLLVDFMNNDFYYAKEQIGLYIGRHIYVAEPYPNGSVMYIFKQTRKNYWLGINVLNFTEDGQEYGDVDNIGLRRGD